MAKTSKRSRKSCAGRCKNQENWSAADKFSVVLETAALNEVELVEYCRKKGLYIEWIDVWKQDCMNANAVAAEQEKASKEQAKQDQKRIKALERELRQKAKALAETAALLVLRKKANAIWGEGEDECSVPQIANEPLH